MRKLRMHELNRLSVEKFQSSPKNPIVVVLDNVRSTLNVGSVFRTSDAFLIEKIYLCGITPTPNKEMNKTALGATESVNWQHYDRREDIIQELEELDYKIIAVEQTDHSIPLQDFPQQAGQKLALVFGHEVTGVDDEFLRASAVAVEIPQFGTKHSLNISVSAGICIWEFCRIYLK